jgi:importin subunit beta-1
VYAKQSENWRQREAAVMAFGAVLESPDEEKLAPLVRSAMPILVTLMRDG